MKKNLKLRSLLKASAFFLLVTLFSCEGSRSGSTGSEVPFLWENANVYFLLTDRFNNGNPDNDLNFERSGETAVLRGFEGGDIRGIIAKIEDGYFDRLGISALWMTPWFEQNRGITDEGTGPTYAYHGYWIRDWTSLDPNFGTETDLENLVETAHRHGIRILMDVVINHTGPVTPADPAWPEEWVRTSPACTYTDYQSTIECTLVENLPDIRTDSDEAVDLPPALLEKWEAEGRLEKEMAELDAFFKRTGYPRAPRYYIIKWLSDYVRKYGIDGYRLDTAKHIEEGVWKELRAEASLAFSKWKEAHPEKVLDQNGFFMVGEVYGYGIQSGRLFDFGDRKVDFYAQDINSMINFAFKSDAEKSFEELFSSYSELLQGPLKGQGVLNYLASHDDHHPFDAARKRALEAGTKLLLAPGACQVYYGDECSRILHEDGAVGDANLRSVMNWEDHQDHEAVLEHYSKLGRFRRDHPSVGAGIHRMLSAEPYTFSRTYADEEYSDKVVVGLGLEKGEKVIELAGVFKDGSELSDHYSGRKARVEEGRVSINSDWDMVLLSIDK